MMHRYLSTLAVLILIMAGCAPTPQMVRGPEPVAVLPAIPEADGPVVVRLVYPASDATISGADSTFLFGSVGTGRAHLSINGFRIPVAPNGAFLAFLPVPLDGVYAIEARAHGQTVRDTVAVTVRPAAPAGSARPSAAAAPGQGSPLRRAVVTGGRDTLATGSDVVYGAPSPTADRRWFFPRRARVLVAGRSGGQYRVQLAPGLTAWVDTAGVQVQAGEGDASRLEATVQVVPSGRTEDLVLRGIGFAPFHLRPEARQVDLTIYGVQGGASPEVTGSRLIESASWLAAGDSSTLRLTLREPLWGYKAFYDTTGGLVLRLRRPPVVQPGRPLEGLHLVVDPGHPPGGAMGPTGLSEAEANLAVALRLAEMLRERGARVDLTRTTGAVLRSASSSAQELGARLDLAVSLDADLLVSVHNNAFPDGVNPFLHHGTETYYYHPFSRGLAEHLLDEIVAVTGIPRLGAKARSLALARPTWMPSTLTESLFMMFPQQESALRDPSFRERLAAAHARGIERFVASTLGSGTE